MRGMIPLMGVLQVIFTHMAQKLGTKAIQVRRDDSPNPVPSPR